MSKSLFTHPKLQRAKHKFKVSAERLIDQHISLAVTGLSGSGKTAFITSLVNQLLEANDQAHLPFFSVSSEKRLIGVKRDIQPNLTFNRFAYEDAIGRLVQQPAQWPVSTKGVSQVRLKIKFRHSKGLLQYISEDSTLTIDITDYPGEWLLDLPLLNMSFEQWQSQCLDELADQQRLALANDFMGLVEELDLNAPAKELTLQNIAKAYSAYLVACQKQGYKLLQPGRFILPGELLDAPVLHFFPIPQHIVDKQSVDFSHPKPGSNLDVLIRRFSSYKQDVIKPFYQDHFKRFDRQVVLVDCLSALNNGFNSFKDLQHALQWIMGSFQYGSSNILNRLFKPKIDKLVFAASKADHITPDQQPNLVKLLESMLHEARQQIQYEGVTTESTAIAAIKASTSGMTQVNGDDLAVLQGINKEGEKITLFPGEVPTSCPDKSFWQQQSFAFPAFLPIDGRNIRALPHIRMDHVLEFLFADKLL